MKRYKFPLIVGGIVIVVLIAAYMAWISPEGSKLSQLNSHKESLTSQEQSLSAEIANLRTAGKNYHLNCTKLSTTISQIPIRPDEGQFLGQIDNLATQSGTSLPGYTINTALPNSSTSSSTKTSSNALPALSFTLKFSGTYSEITSFLNRLDTLPRLYTVASYSLAQSNSSSGSSTGTVTIIPISAVPYTVTLVGNIYYNPTEKDVCAKPRAS